MASWFKNNFYLVFFGIFASIGTIMGIAAASVWLRGIAISNKGVHTTGVVTQMVGSSSLAPIVEFTLENGEKHSYRSNISSSPPSYEVGEYVELWYNPANPNEVQLSGMDTWFLPLLFGLFFLIFGGIGYGGLLYQLFKKRDKTWLLQNGQAIQADLTSVHLNTSVRMNGVSPFAIQCQWLDPSTNKVYVFESDHIWFDPSPYVKGDKIRVLIHPQKPGLYSVDTSFLPEMGN